MPIAPRATFQILSQSLPRSTSPQHLVYLALLLLATGLIPGRELSAASSSYLPLSCSEDRFPITEDSEMLEDGPITPGGSRPPAGPTTGGASSPPAPGGQREGPTTGGRGNVSAPQGPGNYNGGGPTTGGSNQPSAPSPAAPTVAGPTTGGPNPKPDCSASRACMPSCTPLEECKQVGDDPVQCGCVPRPTITPTPTPPPRLRGTSPPLKGVGSITNHRNRTPNRGDS